MACVCRRRVPLRGGVSFMSVLLSGAELRVMAIVWREGQASARHIADVLASEVGYSASATYTLVSRCIKKGALERRDPGYICVPLMTQEQVQDSETDDLIDRLFGGSADKLFAALVSRKKVSRAELDRLRAMVDEMD